MSVSAMIYLRGVRLFAVSLYELGTWPRAISSSVAFLFSIQKFFNLIALKASHGSKKSRGF
jgi:hypothetical protein